jgi:hypothetical protein
VRIFLSYPLQNKPDAERIASSLTAAGIDVWAYMTDVPQGTDFSTSQKMIQAGIENADAMVLLVSSATQRAAGVQREILYAQARQLTIVPVVIEPGSPTDKLPISLLSYETLSLVDSSIDQLVVYLKNLASAQSPAEKTPISDAQLERDRNVILSDAPVARIFIAYSRRQRPIARELSEMLTRNRKAVFWDANIRVGAVWRQTIQKALDEATHVVVLWTRDAAESNEVEREVSYALAEGKVIIPILSKDIPKLPYHLHGLNYIVLEENLPTIETPLLTAIAQFGHDEEIWL